MANVKLEKMAANQSKTNGAQYVVYVPDQGPDVFDSAQMDIYRNFVFVDAVFIDGLRVADMTAELTAA